MPSLGETGPATWEPWARDTKDPRRADVTRPGESALLNLGSVWNSESPLRHSSERSPCSPRKNVLGDFSPCVFSHDPSPSLPCPISRPCLPSHVASPSPPLSCSVSLSQHHTRPTVRQPPPFLPSHLPLPCGHCATDPGRWQPPRRPPLHLATSQPLARPLGPAGARKRSSFAALDLFLKRGLCLKK